VNEEALLQKPNDIVDVDPEFHEFARLDVDARAKAIKRRETSNKKKVERLEEAKKKSEETKKKRLATQSEKEKAKKRNDKVKRGGKKRKADTSNLEPVASTVDMREGSSGFSLPQDRLVHGLTPTSQSFPPVLNTDECIYNLSMGSLVNNDKAFDDVLAFLDMEISHSQAFQLLVIYAGRVVTS